MEVQLEIMKYNLNHQRAPYNCQKISLLKGTHQTRFAPKPTGTQLTDMNVWHHYNREWYEKECDH